MIISNYSSSLFLTHHIDNQNVADAPDEDDDAKHDGDEELGDDVDVPLLVLGQGHVVTDVLGVVHDEAGYIKSPPS